ncbi:MULTISPECIES: hypothetical protein, partial [unclassified Serratia (in: enterobacteria)]|uniref:hypothetical protein n=1 Tax=unclassified Serratia (in: enterobacteria) TaxID=2647522 RepID=UPI0030763869
MAKQVRPQVRQSETDEGILARRDVRNSPGGFHHGSGHRKAQKKTGYMAAIPVHFIQEKHWHHRE